MAGTVRAKQSAESTSLSERIVREVAEVRGCEPTSLEPLYTAIDPDALDRLFDMDRSGVDRSHGRVVFTYCGCEVSVADDGTVQVSEDENVVSQW